MEIRNEDQILETLIIGRINELINSLIRLLFILIKKTATYVKLLFGGYKMIAINPPEPSLMILSRVSFNL